MPWPEKVLRQFEASPPTPIQNDFHGAYNKLLNTLFPPDTDFTVVPQYLEHNSLKGTDFIVMFEVVFRDKPVFVLQLKKPSTLLYDSRRQMADDQIRQRMVDVRRQCPIPTLYGISAIGTRLCFYRLDLTQAQLQIMPPAIPDDPLFTIDTAPEERWDCSVLDAEGEAKLSAVVDEIKQNKLAQACDDEYPVFVNGVQIGTGKGPQNGAVIYTAALNPDSKNTFTASVNNTVPGSAGLITTILVDYTDDTTETIVTDSTWKTLKDVAPGGWTSPSFDDSAWTAADVEGPSTTSPAINMTTAGWLQTNEDVSSGSAPRGHRPFRKTFTSPYGKTAVCGKVVLSIEDSYTLYINGKTIGTGSGWTAMQAYSIPQLDPDVNVVAVDGANARADSRVYLAAGVLMAYNDGTSETYYTDASWKTLSALPPTGFEQPDADDSEWVASTLWAGGPVGNGATVPNA